MPFAGRTVLREGLSEQDARALDKTIRDLESSVWAKLNYIEKIADQFER